MSKEDPVYQHLAIRAVFAWSQGSFSEKLDEILACFFPHHLEINPSDLLRFRVIIQQSEDAYQVVMEHPQAFHTKAKLMSQNAASYQKVSSKYEAIPVSMRSDYDQMCRKRSWLFGHLKETIQGHPNLMAALDESIREPMNPNRYDDAVLRWQIKPDPEIIMPLLKGAFQSDAYPSESSIRLAVLMGDQAMPLLKPFLQHEDGAVRIDIFSKICRVVENRNIITRYFTMAQEGAGETIVRRLEIYSEIYLQQ